MTSRPRHLAGQPLQYVVRVGRKDLGDIIATSDADALREGKRIAREMGHRIHFLSVTIA